MSAKRPNQNANGQAKQPSANPQGLAAHAGPPGMPSTAPHAALKSQLASSLAGAPPGAPGGAPPQPGAGSQPAGDLGMLQTRVQFKDLPPIGQSQVEQQMGLNPYAMLQMGQQQVAGAAQQAQAGNPQANPMVPNSLSGPGIPQDAQVDNFPHDQAALLQHMQAGYSPGADPMQHAQAQNAHAIARAQAIASQQSAQNTAFHQDNMMKLVQLMHRLHMSGQLPPPEQVAQHVLATAPPQLQGAMMGGASPGGPVVNG